MRKFLLLPAFLLTLCNALYAQATIDWATYFGGTGSQSIHKVAYDHFGNAYISGQTNSPSNMSTAGSFQPGLAMNGSSVSMDGYLAKFNHAGVLIWATYYGTSAFDKSEAVACDNAGNVYIAGTTSMPGLSTPGSHSSTIAGGVDIFIVKFDSMGNRQWSTYFGGSGSDDIKGLACDSDNNLYVLGYTQSDTGIATQGSFKATKNLAQDVFLAKFNTQGVRQWGTYFGGDDADYANDIAIDPYGNIAITGQTWSRSNITSPGSHQPAYDTSGPTSGRFATRYPDAFLAKFNSNGARLWSTYYGGGYTENGTAVATDNSGNIYLGGFTNSGNAIGTAGTFKPDTVDFQLSGGTLFLSTHAFLAKFDSSGARQWGTYYGTYKTGAITGLKCNPEGAIYAIGATTDTAGIATPGSYQSVYQGNQDNYIVKFDSKGQREWGTYYGGPQGEFFGSIDFNREKGIIYISGGTNSATGIATNGSYQSSLIGTDQHSYLAKLNDCAILSASGHLEGDTIVCPGTTYTYSYPDVKAATTYQWLIPSGWSGESNSNNIEVTTGTESGVIRFAASNYCSMLDTQQLNIRIAEVNPVIAVNGFVLGTTLPYASYQWYFNGSVIPDASQSTYTVTENGAYSVVVFNEAGCSDTSVPYTVSNVTRIEAMASDNISVYPNPFSDMLYLEGVPESRARITSLDGKTIWSGNVPKTIPTGNFAEGIYFLHLINEDGRTVRIEKIIKAKR